MCGSGRARTGSSLSFVSQIALKHGIGLRQVIEMVRVFRQKNSTTPVVLMGYLNPVEIRGPHAFAQQARA